MNDDIKLPELPKFPEPGGDPMTLGEPAGYALFRQSHDRAEQQPAQAAGGVVLQFTSVHERLPEFCAGKRVLIYTDGYDFNGEQFFDVPADSLNESSFEHEEDQPEICRRASHWIYLDDLRALLAQQQPEVNP